MDFDKKAEIGWRIFWGWSLAVFLSEVALIRGQFFVWCGINMHALSFFFFKVLYSLKFWWGSYNFDSYFKSNSSFDFKILSITITLDYI